LTLQVRIEYKRKEPTILALSLCGYKFYSCEVPMYVKVISRRLFRISKKEKLIPLLQSLRKSAEKEKGFISRSTYSSMNDPGEYIVISEWETADDGIRGINKKKVQQLQWDIDSILGEKTLFDVYLPEDF
jgi:heme-degrading monooxygenase HmoA